MSNSLGAKNISRGELALFFLSYFGKKKKCAVKSKIK